MKYGDIANEIKSIEGNMNSIMDAIGTLRKGYGSSAIAITDARNDQRYAVKLLINEHDRLTEKLEEFSNREVSNE